MSVVSPDVPGPEVKAHPVRSVRDLIAWQRTYALALDVIRATEGFPKEERFGLTAQARRAAVSVPSNIAEGFGRGSRQDYIRFLYIARGSLYELSTQLSLAADLAYFPEDSARHLLSKLDDRERVLWGLIRALEHRTPSS